MIQIPVATPIYVVKSPMSFNKRLKGTLALCRDLLEVEPLGGALFVFRNKSGTTIRIVFYDGDGFWFCEKSFSRGRLKHWLDGDGELFPATASDLMVLLWRGDTRSVNFPDLWSPLQEAC
jgi:hypothetical protein